MFGRKQVQISRIEHSRAARQNTLCPYYDNSGDVEDFKKIQRNLRNRESAMLSRERKNIKMSSLENENDRLKNENFLLKSLLLQANVDIPTIEFDSYHTPTYYSFSEPEVF